jgi:hypothetical protein
VDGGAGWVVAGARAWHTSLFRAAIVALPWAYRGATCIGALVRPMK